MPDPHAIDAHLQRIRSDLLSGSAESLESDINALHALITLEGPEDLAVSPSSWRSLSEVCSLMLSARSGVAAARRRLQEIRSAQTCATYRADGRANSIWPGDPKAEQRL